MAWDQYLDDLINFSEFHEILTKVCPFFDSTIIAMEKLCQHDIVKTDSARILIFSIWLRINI